MERPTSTLIISVIVIMTIYSGLSFTPYDSSWKNLIRPALEAGIPGLEVFFFLLIVAHPLIYA
jgi:hypothetical protein